MQRALSRGLGVLLLLAVLVIGTGAGVYRFVINPHVIEQLRTSPESERAHETLLLTLPGGRVIPVNYVREGDTVYLGADFGWWRAFRGEGAAVQLLLRGQMLSGHARAVRHNELLRRRVFARLRADVPQWLPRWADATLIVIELAAAESNGPP